MRSSSGLFRCAGLSFAALVLAFGPAASPATAACPQTTSPTYTDACGPSFVLPGWGDAGGWTDPEQYTTIQLADVDGDGADELLGRTPTGLAVQVFDKSFGQWRPQVDSEDRPIVLTAFADPPPLTTANPTVPKTDWRLPQYYDTIQAANIDGQPGDEVLARSADGIIVFKFTPGTAPGKGSWQQLSQSGPLAGSAWDAPYYYATIQTGDLNGDRKHELLARGSAGITALGWDGKSWTTLPAPGPAILSDKDGFQDAKYYTSIQLGDVVGDSADELLARSAGGVSLYRYDGSIGWSQLSSTHPFSDQLEQSDCPMSSASTACLGAGPTYYSTLQLADIDGSGQADLVARANDGLSAYFFDPGVSPGLFRPATGRLGDLSDAQNADKEPYYATLQFADINGDGTEEALARDKDGLQGWSFDGTRWSKLSPNPVLALADDPWGDTSTTAAGDRSRSYYGTIQTGDVNGDRRADVVARGPYGIRTWFYNRRGTGGWERYQDEGYTAFTGNEELAYAWLNTLARSKGYLTGTEQALRDLWRDGAEPTTEDLNKVMFNLPTDDAGCGTASGVAPPQYQSCTLPTGASGFNGTDWTAVINKIVTEAYYADQVVEHLSDVRDVWVTLFLAQLTAADSIADQLKITAAKDTETTFDPKELFSGIFGIGGAIIGAIPGGEPIAAGIEIASEVMSMIPSASESLTDELTVKYSELDDTFATVASGTNKSFAVHSQLIRHDLALMTLVAQLRSTGTWKLDKNGMQSAGQQGFALWVYQTLLPTIYARYVITNCQPSATVASCAAPSAGTSGQLGAAPNFTLIGPPPTRSTPCAIGNEIGDAWNCNFVAPASDLAGKLWGQLSPTCAYDGKNAGTIWTFGCNLGVDPQASVAASPLATRDWGFGTHMGNPVANGTSGLEGSVARVGQDRSLLRLSGRMNIPRSLRLGGARVAVHRLLHEVGGEGELASGRSWSPLVLSPRSRAGKGGQAFSSQARGKPRVRMRLRRRSRTSVAFVLRARTPSMSLPEACSGVRRGLDLAAGPVFLHTRLRIRDRSGRSLPISVRPHWRCRRNRLGAVQKLVVRQPEARTPSRGGLAVALRGPRRARAGGKATYILRVRNRRRTAAFDVLVHGLLPRGLRASRARGSQGGPRYRTWRLARLRPGRARTMRLRVRVASTATGAKQVVAVAEAIDTRHVSDRLVARIRP